MARIRSIKRDEWPRVPDVPFTRCAIYVVAESGTSNYKIGIARHPVRRLAMLQGGNPRRLLMVAMYEGGRLDCADIERRVLKAMRSHCIGEWVVASDVEDIITTIEYLGGIGS